MVKAILLKPLDGREIGDEVEFSQADFDRLESKGAVKAASTKSAPAPENKMEPAPSNKAKRGKKGS